MEQKERLYDEMIGLFTRSKLPESERPNVIEDGYVTDELKHALKMLSTSIRSCGFRYSTLIVFVDDSCDPKTLESGVQEITEKHGIASFSIEPLFLKNLSVCKVGAKLEAHFADGSSRAGTLGGFGAAVTEKKREDIALVSRHVVAVGDIPARNIRIQNEGEHVQASALIDRSLPENKQSILDIAAISFNSGASAFNTNYLTSEGREAKGVLKSYSSGTIKGLPVYINGASSPMGYGTVIMSKIEAVREDDLCDNDYIVIEDSLDRDAEGKSFCKAGDSGAIVFSDDQENYEHVQLISMVIGENSAKKGMYFSLKLDKGIEQVEEEISSKSSKYSIKLL